MLRSMLALLAPWAFGAFEFRLGGSSSFQSSPAHESGRNSTAVNASRTTTFAHVGANLPDPKHSKVTVLVSI